MWSIFFLFLSCRNENNEDSSAFTWFCEAEWQLKNVGLSEAKPLQNFTCLKLQSRRRGHGYLCHWGMYRLKLHITLFLTSAANMDNDASYSAATTFSFSFRLPVRQSQARSTQCLVTCNRVEGLNHMTCSTSHVNVMADKSWILWVYYVEKKVKKMKFLCIKDL